MRHPCSFSRVYIPEYMYHAHSKFCGDTRPQELGIADGGGSNGLGVVDLWGLVNASQLGRRRSGGQLPLNLVRGAQALLLKIM